MRKWISSLNKDRLEIVRGKKNLLAMGILFACALYMFLSTRYLPIVLERLVRTNPSFLQGSSLLEFSERFFPISLKKNIGIFASDIGVFYSLFVVVMTYGLLPDEMYSGKIIFPLCSGYSEAMIMISKELSYGIVFSAPVFAFYMLYYMISSQTLHFDYSFTVALGNALILSYAEFLICINTIILSSVLPKKNATLLIMLFFVIGVPDLFHYFHIGKFLPSYLLTYVYNSYSHFLDILCPAVLGALEILLLNIIVIKANLFIAVGERR